MEQLVVFIIIFTLILIIVSTYKSVKQDQNKELIKNMEEHAKKEKIKQQESKILGQKQIKRKSDQKKRTRMYHI
tara:strand:+ start:360 stop:581 length:222 start_codon:yes stop_codon:yes gene_type:complete